MDDHKTALPIGEAGTIRISRRGFLVLAATVATAACTPSAPPSPTAAPKPTEAAKPTEPAKPAAAATSTAAGPRLTPILPGRLPIGVGGPGDAGTAVEPAAALATDQEAGQEVGLRQGAAPLPGVQEGLESVPCLPVQDRLPGQHPHLGTPVLGNPGQGGPAEGGPYRVHAPGGT